jgi:hypothetical protein
VLILAVFEVGLMHHLGDLAHRLVRDGEALHERLERAVVAVVRELDLNHIVRQGLGMLCGVVSENKSRLWVNEFADEPRGTNAVDFRARAGEPCLALEAARCELRRGFRSPGAQRFRTMEKHLDIVRFRTFKKVDLSNLLEARPQLLQLSRQRLVAALLVS